LVWNDTRTHDICEKLIEQGGKERFRAVTGLPISPYFSATKLKYLLDLIPDLRRDALNGDALFGTIDSFLIWKLTGGKGSFAFALTSSLFDLLIPTHCPAVLLL
jgi:glycerol kinase